MKNYPRPFFFEGIEATIIFDLQVSLIHSSSLTNKDGCSIVAFKVPHSTPLPHCDRFSICGAARARRL